MNRDDANEGTQAYIKNYQAEYKMEPDMVGASVYDAFQVLFAAFENVGTDPAAMRDYIAGLKDFDTVTGTLMYYTSAGSAVKPVQIQQVGDDILFHSYGIIDDINIIDGDKVEKVTY
ncbi:MAG: ABC transporter substrate-binding protein [Clostridia bacterium]